MPTILRELGYQIPVLDPNGSIFTLEGYSRKNLLKLIVYFDTLEVIEVTETPSYPLWSFLSELGGTLGLWLGASLLTFFEFFELLLDLYILLFRRHIYPKKKFLGSRASVQPAEQPRNNAPPKNNNAPPKMGNSEPGGPKNDKPGPNDGGPPNKGPGNKQPAAEEPLKAGNAGGDQKSSPPGANGAPPQRPGSENDGLRAKTHVRIIDNELAMV